MQAEKNRSGYLETGLIGTVSEQLDTEKARQGEGRLEEPSRINKLF